MTAYHGPNEYVVDLSYEVALIHAFEREAEGKQGVDVAVKMFPELTPFIFDTGDGVAHLDVEAAVDRAYQALEAKRFEQPRQRIFLSSLGRGIRLVLQIVLCFLPLVLGGWVAITTIVNTHSWATRVLAVMLGWCIIVFGYVLLIAICSVIRGFQEQTPYAD